MRAVDTNVVVRLITRDDAGQAVRADALVRRGGWLSIVALSEVAWVLSSYYALSRTALADAITMLLHHDHLTLEQAPAVERAVELFRRTPGVSFADCLLIEVARHQGFTPLATFDRKLAKLDGAELITS